MSCGYETKGCAFAENCEKTYHDCAKAKYFDFLIANSEECKNSGLKTMDFVAMNRDKELVDERCRLENGCSKITEFGFCSAFVRPSVRWPNGEPAFENKCVLADHLKFEKKKGTVINPLKASKRARRGR